MQLPESVRSLNLSGHCLVNRANEVRGPWLPEGIEHLDLSNGVVNKSGAVRFLQHLPSMLKTLKIGSHEDHRLPPAGITNLAFAMPPRLELLDLSGAQWSIDAADIVAIINIGGGEHPPKPVVAFDAAAHPVLGRPSAQTAPTQRSVRRVCTPGQLREVHARLVAGSHADWLRNAHLLEATPAAGAYAAARRFAHSSAAMAVVGYVEAMGGAALGVRGPFAQAAEVVLGLLAKYRGSLVRDPSIDWEMLKGAGSSAAVPGGGANDEDPPMVGTEAGDAEGEDDMDRLTQPTLSGVADPPSENKALAANTPCDRGVRVLRSLYAKLEGSADEGPGVKSSVVNRVLRLIDQAMDEGRLACVFKGWTPWL
ncbi:hypothetical protein H9P43_006483 [Blastocladiella emersonii ATCC 22665]|nr:hypothetical protein H9P43_006483 [Blastocladiella emersonii ATCC 22665]